MDRGADFLTYVRYLDDMVVLAPDSEKGRRWATRALERIGEEAGAIGVSLNAEKTRTVCMTDTSASFAFLGFEFRWVRSNRTGNWFACMTPRNKKVVAILRKIRTLLRFSRHLPMPSVSSGKSGPIRSGKSDPSLQRSEDD